MTIEHPMIESIERSVQFMQTELQNDRTPTLDHLATVSGMSKYHFHRIFKLVTGETCGDAMTRLRLARGTAAMQDIGSSVTQAALAAGYSSSQAFAKALKRELATSATSLRSDPERLAETVRTLLEPNQITNVPAYPPMRIEICSLEPLELIFIRTIDRFPDLAETYGRLAEVADGPQNVRAFLGLPHRDTSTSEANGFVFDCALLPISPVSNIPADMRFHSISQGTYLVVRHIGIDAELPRSLDTLYTAVLTQPDLHISDEPCIFHFVDDPEETTDTECRTDIYVRIETLS